MNLIEGQDISTLELYLKYCHLQYNEGNYLFAGTLASNLFESYMHYKTKNKFKDLDHPLPEAI